MDPLAFMARLAALVPRPRANLIRYHGVFAPNFKHRKLIVPKHSPSRHRDPDKPTAPLTWMQRLQRVFQIDIELCPHCGGTLLPLNSSPHTAADLTFVLAPSRPPALNPTYPHHT